MRTRGMQDAAAVFSIETADQVYKEVQCFMYLGENVDQDYCLSNEVDRRWSKRREQDRGRES